MEFILKAAELLFNAEKKKKKEKASNLLPATQPTQPDDNADGIAGKLLAGTIPSAGFEHLSLGQWTMGQGDIFLFRRYNNNLKNKRLKKTLWTEQPLTCVKQTKIFQEM